MTEFPRALEVFQKRKAIAKLTTGSRELDGLLGGGLESGRFYLLYGDNESVDYLIHRLLVSSIQSEKAEGCKAQVLYLNCGNYREEKTILDTQLLSFMMKSLGMDPIQELDRIHVLCAFSDEQQEDIVGKAQDFLKDHPEIRLILVHHVAKLFTRRQGSLNERLERVQRLQSVVFRLWQTAAQRNVIFVASCKPNPSSMARIPKPEGGRYLRHMAGAIIYLRGPRKGSPVLSAYLLKHPGLEARKVDFKLSLGGECMGRVTEPFSIVLVEEMSRLKRNYQRALKEPSRREAFNSLMQVWSSERGAMNNSEVPTALDVMLLTAIVDNRRLIRELSSRLDAIQSDVKEIKRRLEE